MHKLSSSDSSSIDDGELEDLDELLQNPDSLDQLQEARKTRALRRQIWCLKMVVILMGFSLSALTVYAVFSLSREPTDHSCGEGDSYEWSGRLGEDPSEFVPQGIGQPLRLTYYDASHPYHFADDMFDTLDGAMTTIRKVRAMHNSSNVLANQRYATWFHPPADDQAPAATRLHPFFSWKTQRQMYTLRGFHQLSCVLVIVEEYAHRLHASNNSDSNSTSSRWGPGHVVHCLNTLRDAVMCMADATPMTFVNGFQMGYVTDEQAYMCRDWEGLRTWANDPVRGVRTSAEADVADGTDDGELTVGALYDFEEPNEIVPFPKLTEAEAAGLM